MKESATSLIQALPDSERLALFAARLRGWLVSDLNAGDEPAPEFTESRARALLRAADLLDEPARHTFERSLENETFLRVALFDLLVKSELAIEEEVAALAIAAAAGERPHPAPAVDWPGLAIAAFAWNNGYPLYQLDPASPPSAYSPAGQVLKRAAQYMRRQVQRSATEREKIGRTLVFSADRGPGLDQLSSSGSVAPLPPYYRMPIPVRYPEVASETVHVDPDEQPAGSSVQRGEPLTITDADLAPSSETAPPTPAVRAPIQITAQESARPQPTQVVTPNATVATSSDFARSVRRKIGRGKSLKATKLTVVVQEYPDGPGLYGLQVRVRCKGIKSHVAGTTTRAGEFVCELPVPEATGLTYDVDVTWPRELGGETERKSVTLNADRRQFTLPFYHRLSADDKA